MARRHCWRWFDYRALCADCGWELFAKNALGLAAQHHDRTGHNVNVEIHGHVSYCNDAEDARRKKEKGR